MTNTKPGEWQEGNEVMRPQPVSGDSETTNEVVAIIESFDQLYIEGDPATVEIPGGADRLMHPPVSVQVRKELHELSEHSDWKHQFSWVPDDKIRDENGELVRRRQEVEDLEKVSDERESVYRKFMQKWLEKHHNMQFGPDAINPDWMATTKRISSAYRDLVQLYKEQGYERLVTFTPAFSDFQKVATEEGIPNETVAMIDGESGWSIDWAVFEQALQPNDILLLSNPNNPNGYVYTKEDMDRIVRLCKSKGVKIISDDVWSDIVLSDDTHQPVINSAQEQDYAEHTVMLYGTTKAFNTGLLSNCTAITADKNAREALQQNRPAALACELAIDTIKEDGTEYLKELNPVLRENTEYVAAALRAMDCHVHNPSGTMLLFAKLPEHGEVITSAMKSVNYQYDDGDIMGMPGYIRVNAGVPFPILKDRLEKIKQLIT